MSRTNKKNKQKEARDKENFFGSYCERKKIVCCKLEEDPELKKKFLVDSQGKCPDFFCKKRRKNIFVEIKTLTNLTNSAREKIIEKKTRITIVSEKWALPS